MKKLQSQVSRFSVAGNNLKASSKLNAAATVVIKEKSVSGSSHKGAETESQVEDDSSLMEGLENLEK